MVQTVNPAHCIIDLQIEMERLVMCLIHDVLQTPNPVGSCLSQWTKHLNGHGKFSKTRFQTLKNTSYIYQFQLYFPWKKFSTRLHLVDQLFPSPLKVDTHQIDHYNISINAGNVMQMFTTSFKMMFCRNDDWWRFQL